MKNPPIGVPALYVEGADDISAIAALLKRHGYDTNRGRQHLFITHAGNDLNGSSGGCSELLAAMPDVIRASPSQPCGFVFDIDIELMTRWDHVRDRLNSLVSSSISFEQPIPKLCEQNGQPGFVGRIKDYSSPFGVWLMPDCKSDHQKLEHLLQSLIAPDDAILEYAKECTAKFPKVVDDANILITDPQRKLRCFPEKDRIKAEIRTWLAWQEEPGQPFGTAITKKYLSHDSPCARSFLNWLSQLYGFQYPGPDPV